MTAGRAVEVHVFSIIMVDVSGAVGGAWAAAAAAEAGAGIAAMAAAGGAVAL